MKKLLVSLGIFVVVVIGGLAACVAMLGGAANQIDKELKEEARHDKPSRVHESKAFHHDKWGVEAGWKVTNQFGAVDIKRLFAENTGDDADSPLLTFQFLRGDRVVATADCTGDQVEPGKSIRLTCLGDRRARNYRTVTVEDMF